MIEAKEIMKKLGKDKFVEFVSNAQDSSQTGAAIQHRRRWGKGRTFMAHCIHGIKTIDNYEPTNECSKCIGINRDKSGEFKPYFNLGLGVYCETRSDERKVAKQKGLVCVG
jgi:hypothetical protein